MSLNVVNYRSWRDDIESLGYVFLYFMNPEIRYVPWFQGGYNIEKLKEQFIDSQIMDGEVIPEELIAIQRFLREAKLIKAEERPNYDRIKQLAGALEIFVSRGEEPNQANKFGGMSQLRMESRSFLKDSSSLAKMPSHD
jgi:hypothetical protein